MSVSGSATAMQARQGGCDTGLYRTRHTHPAAAPRVGRCDKPVQDEPAPAGMLGGYDGKNQRP